MNDGIPQRSLSDGAEADAPPPSPSTVPCPDCHRPATVLGSFTTGGADNPSEFLRIQCTGLLTLLIPAADAQPGPQDPAG